MNQTPTIELMFFSMCNSWTIFMVVPHYAEQLHPKITFSKKMLTKNFFYVNLFIGETFFFFSPGPDV